MSLISLPVALVASYDPPCDPGFNCEGLSDDALTGGIILWLIFLGGCVLLLVVGTVAGWTKSLYWRIKYGSADGVKSERESLQRRGYKDFSVSRQKNDVAVSFDCPRCGKWNFRIWYRDTLGKSQAEACEWCGDKRWRS